MQQTTFLNVHVKPLNASSGMKIIGDGSFQQKYSRDDNAFYPSYSAILPLTLTVVVNIQDPDGVMSSGPVKLDRIDWYLGEYKPGNKIAENNPDYEVTVVSGVPVLKVKRNTPVNEPILLIGEAFYTNTKTGRQESRIEQQLLSTIYYEASLLSLMAESPTEVIVDPTKIDDSNSSNWHVQLKAVLKSGEFDLTEDNACYWWYVKDGKYTRLITTTDTWLVTSPNSDGTYPRIITVDASRFKNLKLECRAAYKGASESAPSSPTNAALLLQFNVRVDLPVFQFAKQIPIAGAKIEPKDIGTTKPIKMRCEITAGGRVIDNPEKYYNITWRAKNADGTTPIVGYGEYLNTTVKSLGITYTNPVSIEASVLPKIGSWNVEGSIFRDIAANPLFQFGVNQIADELGAYLIKCENGVTPEIVGKLKGNNYMRFDDGSLAPTTINSPEEDKGYNIMYGWAQEIHTIENALLGNEIVSLFGKEPFEYGRLKSRKVYPTLISPGLPAGVNGKFRTMYFNYQASVRSGNGLLGITEFNKPNRTYPKTSLNQFTNNDYAVAHNADKTKTMPFAPLMDWHLLHITNALINKFGTVYLHDPNLFGGGITSNVLVNASNIEQTTGVWYKMEENSPAVFQRLVEIPEFCVDANGTKKNWDEILSNKTSRMECMETQMALSYAAENNIQPNETFKFNGGSYRYYNIPGAKTLLEGEMNAKLVKRIFIDNLSAFDTAGNSITVAQIGIFLQTSVIYGIDLISGDSYTYAGAGLEKVMEIEDATSGLATNPVKLYLCTQQDKITLNKDIVKDSGQLFDFETSSSYAYFGMMPSGTGFYTNLVRGTRIGMTQKGGVKDNTAYVDKNNYTGQPVGKRVRLGHRVRSYGTWSVGTARSLAAGFDASIPSNSFGGGFQVRLPDNALEKFSSGNIASDSDSDNNQESTTK